MLRKEVAAATGVHGLFSGKESGEGSADDAQEQEILRKARAEDLLISEWQTGILNAAAAHWSRLARANDAARLLAFAAGYSEAAPDATLDATLGVAGLSALDAMRLRGLHAETQPHFDLLVEIERFAHRCAAVASREARDAERAGAVALTDEGTGDVELARVPGDSPVVLAVAPASVVTDCTTPATPAESLCSIFMAETTTSVCSASTSSPG